MLEKMGAFFDSRLDGYDEHQLTCIESARKFYPYTSKCLPRQPGANILDLGCGTGLELEEYFTLNPTAKITGIDLAPGMLNALKEKFKGKSLTLILGSYFETPLQTNAFDAAVSVESLHHFTKEEKIPLYTKLQKALKPNGYFILTDYFSMSDKEEQYHKRKLARLKKEQKIEDDELYHCDTPLTVEHEQEALIAAGFAAVEILRRWGATVALKASKQKNPKTDATALAKSDPAP